MNERLQQLVAPIIRNVESRQQSEKIVILLVLLAGLIFVYLSIAFDPVRTNISRLKNEIDGVVAQTQAQQSSYASMLAVSQEDPNKFANDRLAIIAREQSRLDAEISELAGDLISPTEMTTILTSLLGRQSGLELISFQNMPAVPLRADVAASALVSSAETNGQVFEHRLVLEFQGDFFSTLKYLRFLEDISGSFFWDSVRFTQTGWPEAVITLEIHTLSANKGFIGV